MSEEEAGPRVVTPPVPDEDMATEETPAAEVSSRAFKGLYVLPPRQKPGSSSDPNKKGEQEAGVLALPMIRVEEPTASIRAALAEVVGLAHITNYRLELEPEGPKKPIPWKPSLVSPFTGPNAVVAIPAAVKALDEGLVTKANKKVLDDWGDLNALVEQGLQDGSAFRMVLQRYDVATVKDHVTRLRNLLNGNAPSLLSLVDDEVESNEQKPETAVEKTENDGEKKEKLPPKPLPSLPEFTGSTSASNLQDFYYLASGEDPKLYLGKSEALKSKKKKKAKGHVNGADEAVTDVTIEQEIREKLPRLNGLDELSRVDCLLQWSSFHPPPPTRKLIGDIGYLMLTPTDGAASIHVTATPTGFYVNRSSTESGKRPHFDPSPAAEPFFSHALLDCLLQASPLFREAWSRALEASRERAEITQALNQVAPFLSHFRFAIRADFEGFSSPESAAAGLQSLDASFQTPSWLVPHPRHDNYNKDDASAWNRNYFHGSDPIRTEEDLSHHFGIDVRSGGIRDWNEELHLGREMPVETQHERIEKARLIHKVMTEFAEAVLLGVKAISEGQIQPMNPNETIRTQVYLHNNIFFSRAIDAGPETFKLAKGDRAARKSANRELQCNSIFHRLEQLGFYTLATVLVDYLGSRFVCQSILPGILIGDHGHKVLLGAVETGVPLKWDKDLHELLEQKIAKAMMVATRPVLRNALTQERLDEIDRLKKELPSFPEQPKPEIDKEAADPNAVMMTCIPLESKAILGSDKRRYLLDFGRLTPRDANWVSSQKGGTGKWEALRLEGGKSSSAIPSSLDDDECTMCVLRPEVVTRFSQFSMAKYVHDNKEKNKEGNEEEDKGDNIFLTKEGKEFLMNLRLNINVFLPDMKSFDGVNEEFAEQVRQDEQRVRDAAAFLWDEVLPKVTKAVKDGQIHQLPVDGKALTEMLHRQGVNCRYLGRLAVIAQQEEEKDAKIDDDLKHSRLTFLEGRHTMPKCWLELLEVEMVARAAKHVLDSYLIENGGVAAAQPAQTVASFLSAVVSESEETFAQTEMRLEKRAPNEPDEEDFAALTMYGTGGDGDALPSPIRSRQDVWQDIETEIGRRFRYTLTLFNVGNKSGRARYIPLLRRLCQRTGVRLLAKDYDVGSKCLCSGGATYGGKLTGSYPISPLDIYDIVPLMKHTAAYNEGFHPCSYYPTVSVPPLQVSLQDARIAMESAHAHTSQRSLNKGLELAQESLSLYQRVTESPSHPGVIDSMELMASIFHEADDNGMAVLHAEKALSLSIQVGGFDTSSVVNAHLTLFQMLFHLREIERAVKHLRAAIYLLDVMAGPNHTECFSAYHKLGTAYSDKDYHGRYLASALKCFEEAGKRDSFDRLMEGITSKHVARTLSAMGEYKDAVTAEKKAFKILLAFLGKDHKWTKECEEGLQNYTKLAVEKGKGMIENDKMKEEVAKADAVAAVLMAAEEEEKAKKTKKKKGKK